MYKQNQYTGFKAINQLDFTEFVLTKRGWILIFPFSSYHHSHLHHHHYHSSSSSSSPDAQCLTLSCRPFTQQPLLLSAVWTTAACVWHLTPSSATSWMAWDRPSLLGDRLWPQRPWVRDDNYCKTVFITMKCSNVQKVMWWMWEWAEGS